MVTSWTGIFELASFPWGGYHDGDGHFSGLLRLNLIVWLWLLGLPDFIKPSERTAQKTQTTERFRPGAKNENH